MLATERTRRGRHAGTRRSGARGPVTGLVAAAAVLVVSGTVSAPLPPGGTVVAGGLLALLTVGAALTRVRPVVHAAVFADLLFGCVVAGRQLSALWPIAGAVAIAVALLAAAQWPALRPAMPWLRAGRWSPELPWLMAGTVMISAGALIMFLVMTRQGLPDAYVDLVRGWPLPLLIAAGVGFILINPAVEESIWRGVFQTALTETAGVPVAVAVQAVAFGLVHLGGVPGGPFGAVLAGVWGLILGVIRARTGGILYGWLLHVVADVTIVATLAVSIL